MFVQEGKVQLIEHALKVIKETPKAFIVESETQGKTDRISKELIDMYRECQGDEVANAEVYVKGKSLSHEARTNLKATLIKAIHRRSNIDLEAAATFNDW